MHFPNEEFQIENLGDIRAMYVYGCGGHSQVVAEVLADMGRAVKAFINDDPDRHHVAVTTMVDGVRILGPEAFADLGAPVVVAIGDNSQRKEVVEMLPVEWASAIHSTVLMSPTVELGVDNVIVHRSIIQANTRIGSHVLINTGASIDHDNDIGDFVHIAPHATLCGHVTVGEGTFIGVGANVIPGVTIGRWCTIGAGAVVVADVPDYCTAVGVPAKIISRGGTAL